MSTPDTQKTPLEICRMLLDALRLLDERVQELKSASTCACFDDCMSISFALDDIDKALKAAGNQPRSFPTPNIPPP